MKKVVNPKVKQLSKGKDLNVKQMAAKAGDLLPKHLANVESILIMIEGECIINLDGEEFTLKEEDSFIVPAKVIHQIEAIKDFRAYHVMPNNIEFDFFN